MSSIYDKSSLVLIPSGTKSGKVFSQKPVSGDGDFTFSRLTAATRVNADGNIEKETQNKLLRSNKFDTTWGKTNSSVTGGQSGYDGTNTAWKLIASGGNNDKIFQSVTQTGVVTLSAYAKAGNVNFIAFEYVGYAYFNLGTGAVGISGGIIDSKITSVGGGWYRCSISVNPSSTTNAQIYVTSANNSTNTSNGDFVYIQDAQLEQGLVARDYIETTTAAVEGGITDNVPRLDYTDSSCPSLKLEPQRTNLFPHSEYIKGNTLYNSPIITENYSVSPEGLSNAFRIQDTTGTSYRQVRPASSGLSVSANSTYTQSLFVKKATSAITNYGGIGFDYTGGTTRKIAYIVFDEYNGTLAELTSSFPLSATLHPVEDYGDYWRFSVSTTDNGSNTNLSLTIYACLSTNGTNTGTGIKDWTGYGLQLEAGSYATSYIPTYGSSVTRVQDACFGAGDVATFNSTEGVLYAEISALVNPTNQETALSISEGQTGANRLLIRMKTNGAIGIVLRISNTTEASIDSSVLNQSTNHKIAVKYKVNDIALWIDGVEIGTDSSANVFSANTLNEFSFNQGNGSNHFYGNVKQVLTFNTALSDEELATLTTI